MSASIRRSLMLAVFLAGAAAAGSVTAQGPYLGYRPATTVPYAPYSGPFNYAHQQPAFRWGWFGAESFRPMPRWHKGYYGKHYRWTTHR